MKISSKTILQGLERLKARVGVDGLFREVGDDLPLRSELFSVEQLEQHAEALADWHQIDVNHGADRLLARLASNEKVLLEAYRLVTEAVDNKRRISPAGEWLLDNFYLIEEQVRTARRHLPRQYARPAASAQWAIGRLSACVRPGAGTNIARRWPYRCPKFAQLCSRLSTTSAFEAWRNVGDSNYAAPGAP